MEETLNTLIAAVGTIGTVLTVTSAIGTVYSVSTWCAIKRKEKFNEQRIKIRLKMPGTTAELPYEIERKYLTRSELQGLLGILPMREKGKRYDLGFLNTEAFFANLKAAQDEKDRDYVEIVCTEEEQQQFDLDKLKRQCKTTDAG